MNLGELPAAVLDVVVECAGFEHGWRLEVVSSSLQATSMECAAVRLGKCRWMGGDRTEFRPSWRHVAVALRRCPYYLLRPGVNAQLRCPFYLRFLYHFPQYTPPPGPIGRPNASFVPRRQADKFAIEPTGDGEGIIRDHPSGRYNATSRFHGILNYQIFHGTSALRMMPDQNHQIIDAPTPWLLHLGSHASHLPFRRCRNEDGSIRRVLRVHRQDAASHDVPNWELSPATLADDERFEWRV